MFVLDCVWYGGSDSYVILLFVWSIVMIRRSDSKRIFFLIKNNQTHTHLKNKANSKSKYPIPQQVPNTQTQLAKHKPNKGSRQNRSLRSLQGLAFNNKTKIKPGIRLYNKNKVDRPTHDLWFLLSALNVNVTKFKQARVNSGSNYDSFKVAKCLVI